jgi:hypothetical protein
MHNSNAIYLQRADITQNQKQMVKTIYLKLIALIL